MIKLTEKEKWFIARDAYTLTNGEMTLQTLFPLVHATEIIHDSFISQAALIFDDPDTNLNTLYDIIHRETSEVLGELGSVPWLGEWDEKEKIRDFILIEVMTIADFREEIPERFDNVASTAPISV